MKIAAVLPHVEIFGGVRRYIEIGNALTARGHSFVLFHPAGIEPDWLEFRGITRPFSALEDEAFEVALCSEYSVLPQFERLKAKAKFFYFVLEGHKQEKEAVKKNYIFLGASEGISRRIEKKYKVKCYQAAGGINSQIFYPSGDLPNNKDSRDSKDSLSRKSKDKEFRILCYGRIFRKRKGIQHVIHAVNGLYKKFPQIRLIFFDSLVGKDKRDPRPLIKTRVPRDFYLNLPQDRMAWLYSQADLFVSAERREI